MAKAGGGAQKRLTAFQLKQITPLNLFSLSNPLPNTTDQTQTGSSNKALYWGLSGAIATCVAWWFPGSIIGAVLGWVAAMLFCRSLIERAGYRAFYTSGFILHIFGFYWLCGTISRFGGFNWLAASLIFLLFVATGALQFVVVVFIHKHLPKSLDLLALRSAISWTVAECIMIRLFPWQMAHTQLAFQPFVQIADLAGSLGVSFLLFWCAESVVRAFWMRDRKLSYLTSLAVMAAALSYGVIRIKEFSNPEGQSQKVALIQGNIPVEIKHDRAKSLENIELYAKMTSDVQADNLLVIWPETVINEWIYAGIGKASRDPRIPQFEKKVNLLTGALTFLSKQELFNSALAVYSDGTIPEPSHKQILMPYGEYTPLADRFPWMRDLNSQIADFTPGRDIQVFRFPVLSNSSVDHIVKVSSLVCYEDMVPQLSRQAVLKGAELLVNITNDAWYGHSPAASNHNLIASFRAIETRRYLLRATNTGLTSVVGPTGKTLSQLPEFEKGTLLASVSLMSYKSIYVEVLGEYPWLGLTMLCALLVFRQIILNIIKRKTTVSGLRHI